MASPTLPIPSSLLCLWLSRDQVRRDFAGVELAIQEQAHLVDDRSFDPEAPRALERAVRRGHPFGDHVHRGYDVREFFAAAEALADRTVSTMAGETGDHEIADAAKTLEGVALSAQGDTEPDELGKRTSDECGLGIIAEAE